MKKKKNKKRLEDLHLDDVVLSELLELQVLGFFPMDKEEIIADYIEMTIEGERDTTLLVELMIYYLCTGTRLFPKRRKICTQDIYWLMLVYAFLEKDVLNFVEQEDFMQMSIWCQQLVRSMKNYPNRTKKILRSYSYDVPESIKRRFHKDCLRHGMAKAVKKKMDEDLQKGFRPIGSEW